MMIFPEIFRVRQRFEATRVDDVSGEVARQLAKLDLAQCLKPGETVAITAGSRGIANIAEIIRTTAACMKSLGAAPFVVPAMGSHGGGTAEGQTKLLEVYGMTEAFLGCPIRSSMDTVVVGHAPQGFPLHFDRLAFEADHTFVCGRVKPHTSFAGKFESGLMKMLLIGLGKRAGADIYHRASEDAGFDTIVAACAEEVLNKCRVLAGLAIVENAYDETALIEAVEPRQFMVRDAELLEIARRWMPKLPFEDVDVLLIDRIGKNISGTGLDGNVVGRKFNDHRAMPGESPRVKRICLRGLSPESHGNAIGIGMAEFCRTELLEQADMQATRLNVLTSGRVSAAMQPLDYATDREMLAAALGTIGLVGPGDAKLLWIADTLHLAEVECSAAYLNEARQRKDLEIVLQPRAMRWDAAGNLSNRTFEPF
jgi:hypothetical protein